VERRQVNLWVGCMETIQPRFKSDCSRWGMELRNWKIHRCLQDDKTMRVREML